MNERMPKKVTARIKITGKEDPIKDKAMKLKQI